MSIKIKLILIIVGASLFTGLFSGAFIYWQNTKILAAHIDTDIKETINQTAQLINIYFASAESNLANLARDPLIIEALEKKDKARFAQVSSKLTLIKDSVDILENISLMSIDNASCTPRSANQAAASVLGRDFSDRDYCLGILKSKTTYVSSAYPSAISGLPILGLVVPVKNNKGEMLGFVYGSLNLSELRGYLWDLQSSSKVELLDRYGTMFLNTEEKIEKLNNLPATEVAELDKIKKNLLAGKKDGVIRDEDNFVGYKSIGYITIIYEKSVTKLLSMVQTINLIIFTVLLIAMILTITVIYLFVGSITRRISRLSKITEEISDGNFDIKLNEKDLKAKDETAVLASSFGKMSGKLKEVYENLEKKVKERTEELEKNEVKTKESLAQAERLNSLMVGRELEMLKLKKEINDLKNNKPV